MMSKAADSIAKGDLVDNVIRGNQAWGLLPIQVSVFCAYKFLIFLINCFALIGNILNCCSWNSLAW